jgi:actin-like protein 6A
MMNLQEKSSSTDLKNIDFTFLPSDYMHASIAALHNLGSKNFFLILRQVCFPSYVGLKGGRDKAEFVMGRYALSAATGPPSCNAVCCSSALSLRRDDMEVVQPYVNGKVADWDLYLSIVEHTLSKELGPDFDVKGHPLVFSETTHVSERDREHFLEALFEKFSPPAVFFCKSAVLAAFAAAKTTALVVEVGSGVTCVTPVFDGFALQKAAVRCPITGDGLTNLLIDALAQDGITIRPRYSFKKKVAPGAGADEFSVVDVSGTDATHPSYRNMCVQQIAEDLKLSVCRVSETALTPTTIGSGVLQSAAYELPDGRVVNVASPR